VNAAAVGTAVVVAGFGLAASGAVVTVIDGVSYTLEQLAGLGAEALAKLLAAGKLTQAVWARLQPYLGQGAEVSFGKGRFIERINLFGDWRQMPGRTFEWFQRLPQYHRRFTGPGGSIDTHRPWKSPGLDKSLKPLNWWLRF
jgi:hypothetical protein